MKGERANEMHFARMMLQESISHYTMNRMQSQHPLCREAVKMRRFLANAAVAVVVVVVVVAAIASWSRGRESAIV